MCYYFDPAKLAAAAADSDNIDIYPNPDLAAEVDISPPKIDRPGIYAALQVPEFWRVRNKAVSTEQLSLDGTYVLAPRSRFLPVRAEDVTRWICSEDSSSLVTWEARLRQWVRDQLVPEAERVSSPPGALPGHADQHRRRNHQMSVRFAAGSRHRGAAGALLQIVEETEQF